LSRAAASGEGKDAARRTVRKAITSKKVRLAAREDHVILAMEIVDSIKD